MGLCDDRTLKGGDMNGVYDDQKTAVWQWDSGGHKKLVHGHLFYLR